MKRILALTLALLMIFALAGCGSKKREIVKLTLSTEDSEAILAAAGIVLPPVEEAKGANSTAVWYSWYDPFHNYAEDEIIATGFWTFQEKYGGEVEWIECTWGEYSDRLAQLILGGTAPDFTQSGAGVYPGLAVKGLFSPVDDYIDYDDPLWNGTKEFTYRYCALGGKAYSITTDIMFGQVCAYNRRVIEEWGFDDPAALYYNDEWTWDIFYEMCMEFSDPDEDRYALDGWGFSTAIMNSSGAELVYYDKEADAFVANADDPRLERASQLLYDLGKNANFYPVWDMGFKLRNDTEGGGIKDGLQLFSLIQTWGFTGPVDDMSNIWGDIPAGELMFAPLPRDPNGDGRYYTNCNPTGYAFVKGGGNYDTVALLAACERFKIIDPTVISFDRRQLEETYLWTEEMLEMYDICYEKGVMEASILDYDYGPKVEGVVDKFYHCAHGTDMQTWAQVKEANVEALIYYTNQLNEDIAELNMEIAAEYGN